MGTKKVELKLEGRGTVTFAGDLDSIGFGQAIYALSAEKGFDYVFQAALHLAHDEQAIDALFAAEDDPDLLTEDMQALLKEYVDAPVPDGVWTRNITFDDDLEAEVTVSCEQPTVKDWYELVFRLCTIRNAHAVAANGSNILDTTGDES